MRPAWCLGGMLAVFLAGSLWPAYGQRMQFPTAIPTNVAPSLSTGATPGGVSSGRPVTAPGYGGGSAPAFNPGTPSSSVASPPSTYGSPPSTYASPPAPVYGSGAAPGYALPPSNYTPSPGYGPNIAPGPAATFQGGIQPAPTWDPYGTPGSPPPTLLPTDPTLPGSPLYPEGTFAKMQRFLQQIRVDYVWIPGSGIEELGVSDFDFTATFAVPFLYNPDTPLLITPGFGLQAWDGPVTGPAVPIGFSPQTYDAYLDASWNPQATPLLGAEMAFRIGVYSDFARVVGESVRFTGHGLAVLSLSPSFQIKAGIIYLDRRRIKLFPAGGLVWTPNSDVRFEILFPNPKLAKRIATYGNTDWWLYLRGEYGGGSWTIKDVKVVGGGSMQVDYNDLRLGLGLEFDRFSGMTGLFEIGLAFEREIFGDGGTLFTPNNTVYLRGALTW